MNMRILRMALEDTAIGDNKQPQENINAQGQPDVTIELTGPLSEIYTQAMAVVLAKPDNTNSLGGTENKTLESQQIDAAIMSEIADRFKTEDAPPTDAFQTVYGVSRDDVTEDTIVDVSQRLAKKDYKGDFILITDGCRPSKIGTVGQTDYYKTQRRIDISRPAPTQEQEVRNQNRLEMNVNSLESIAYAYGVRVFHSLKEYMQSTI